MGPAHGRGPRPPARLAAALLGLLLLSPGQAQELGYELIDPAQPVRDPQRIEVLEFFWYGCPRCYRLHPHIEAWAANRGADVDFRLVAAPLDPGWTAHSRAYYAAEVLGELERFHEAFFDEIHRRGRRITDPEEIVAFAAAQGIDPAAFRDAMGSFSVELRLRRALQAADAYALSGVPALSVNGKYKITAGLAGGYPQMVRVLQELIDEERGR